MILVRSYRVLFDFEVKLDHAWVSVNWPKLSALSRYNVEDKKSFSFGKSLVSDFYPKDYWSAIGQLLTSLSHRPVVAFLSLSLCF